MRKALWKLEKRSFVKATLVFGKRNVLRWLNHRVLFCFHHVLGRPSQGQFPRVASQDVGPAADAWPPTGPGPSDGTWREVLDFTAMKTTADLKNEGSKVVPTMISVDITLVITADCGSLLQEANWISTIDYRVVSTRWTDGETWSQKMNGSPVLFI